MAILSGRLVVRRCAPLAFLPTDGFSTPLGDPKTLHLPTFVGFNPVLMVP
jgi:hypothetical protein